MWKGIAIITVIAGGISGCAQGPEGGRLVPERTHEGAVIQPERDPAAPEILADPTPSPAPEPIRTTAPNRPLPPARQPVEEPDEPQGVVPAPPPDPTITQPAPSTLPETLPPRPLPAETFDEENETLD